jgi:hypothetical protein
MNAFLSDIKKADRAKHWYSELGALIATAPDLSVSPLPGTALTWVGRVHALLLEMGNTVLAVDFKMAFDYRAGTQLDSSAAQAEKMRTAMYMALGIAERSAPASSRGAYIPVSSAHDALIAISAVLGKASTDVFIIDPYMSQVVLNDFALSLGEGVKLRLMSGHKKTAADFEPALRAWRQQRTTRPVEVRIAKQDTLHDRIIILDGSAWSLSQSFNALAKRSPATLQPFDAEIGLQKTTYYEGVWSTAVAMR